MRLRRSENAYQRMRINVVSNSSNFIYEHRIKFSQSLPTDAGVRVPNARISVFSIFRWTLLKVRRSFNFRFGESLHIEIDWFSSLAWPIRSDRFIAYASLSCVTANQCNLIYRCNFSANLFSHRKRPQKFMSEYLTPNFRTEGHIHCQWGSSNRELWEINGDRIGRACVCVCVCLTVGYDSPWIFENRLIFGTSSAAVSCRCVSKVPESSKAPPACHPTGDTIAQNNKNKVNRTKNANGVMAVCTLCMMPQSTKRNREGDNEWMEYMYNLHKRSNWTTICEKKTN